MKTNWTEKDGQCRPSTIAERQGRMKTKGRKASLSIASHSAIEASYHEANQGKGVVTQRLRKAKRKARAKGQRLRYALQIEGMTISVPKVNNPREKVYQAEIGFNGFTFRAYRETCKDERKAIQSDFLAWLKRQLESERLRDGKELSRFPIVRISFKWKYVNGAWQLVECYDKTRTLRAWELRVS